ncbi:MAG: hypothetical protein LZ169_06340 [Thaumarchaeota archaeon]|nr:hypothetical protein [Candidatus Wolframiiraptor allenii]
MMSAISFQKTASYILSRRGKDGGYLYYQYQGIFDSSAEDTYYAVKSLKLLGIEPPKPEETVDFLKSLQREDGSYSSLQTAYFAIKALKELGSKPRKLEGAIDYLKSQLEKNLNMISCAEDYASSLRSMEPLIENGVLRSWDLTDRLYIIEVSSSLSNISMIVEALNILGCNIGNGRRQKAIDAILAYMQDDGGFGASYSLIDETFRALNALHNLGHDVVNLKKTVEWLRRCEDEYGGFKPNPAVKHSYLISDLYYGLEAMNLLGLSPRFMRAHVEFILKCYNDNGGFRESIHIGLSTLEATFYALSSLAMLGELRV